jgi:hypothetical protein
VAGAGPPEDSGGGFEGDDSDDFYRDDFWRDDVDVLEPYDPPPVPWYRTTPALLAAGAIGVAAIAMLVSAVLLMSDRSGRPTEEPTDVVEPSISTGTMPATTGPATSTPAPPPSVATTDFSTTVPSTTVSANTVATPGPTAEAPQQTRIKKTLITRPPDISTRPTPRPVFPHN